MNDEIPGVDRADLAEWALARMVIAMRKAELAAGDYAHNKAIIANSAVGDRSIPNASEMATLASDNNWYMTQAEMYSAIFTAAEVADDSPNREKYRRIVRAAMAQTARNKIPGQRYPGTINSRSM